MMCGRMCKVAVTICGGGGIPMGIESGYSQINWLNTPNHHGQLCGRSGGFKFPGDGVSHKGEIRLMQSGFTVTQIWFSVGLHILIVGNNTRHTLYYHFSTSSGL